MRPGRAIRVGLVAAAFFAGGCGFTRVDAPLTFVNDDRLDILVPEPDALVPLPVRVVWRSHGFEPGAGNRFALFVDRVPIKPGHELHVETCLTQPDAPLLRDECEDDTVSIFQTTETGYTFSCLKPRPGVREEDRNVHTVTVILVDANDERTGTAASTVSFEVADDDALKECRGFAVD